MAGYYPHLSFKVSCVLVVFIISVIPQTSQNMKVTSLCFHCSGSVVGTATRNVVLRGAGPSSAVLSLALGIIPQEREGALHVRGHLLLDYADSLGQMAFILSSSKLKLHLPS